MASTSQKRCKEERDVETIVKRLQDQREDEEGLKNTLGEFKTLFSSLVMIHETIEPPNSERLAKNQTNLESLISKIQMYMNSNNEWNEDARKVISSLQDENKRLELENKNLTKSKECSALCCRVFKVVTNIYQGKRRVTCQLYCPHDVETALARNELERILKTPPYNADFNLEIKTCASPSDINTTLPTVVICLNYARTGTVIRNALRGIQPAPSVALLILHHKDVHALPPQKTELTEPECKGLGAVIDMAFLSDRGIYQCEMNQKAFAELAEFIKRH